MLDDIIKIKIDEDNIGAINNLGICDFFFSSDNKVKLNLLAVVSNNNYVVATGSAHKFYHVDLEKRVHDVIDDYSLNISAFGDRVIIIGDEITSLTDYSIILGILEEIDFYSKSTLLQKNISINIPEVHGNYVSNYNLDVLMSSIKRKIDSFNSFSKIKTDKS